MEESNEAPVKVLKEQVEQSARLNHMEPTEEHKEEPKPSNEILPQQKSPVGKIIAFIILASLLVIVSIGYLNTSAELDRLKNTQIDSMNNLTYEDGIMDTVKKFYATGVECQALDIDGSAGKITIVATKCLE